MEKKIMNKIKILVKVVIQDKWKFVDVYIYRTFVIMFQIF